MSIRDQIPEHCTVRYVNDLQIERELWKTRKNADGEFICIWCGEPIKLPSKRYRWHKDCVEEYLIRSSGNHVRSAVYKRDKGICAICGLDCGTLEEVGGYLLYIDESTRPLDWSKITRRDNYQFKAFKQPMDWFNFLDELGVTYDENKNLWQADHIVPVSEGGGCCGLSNYRTLCLECHYKVTGRLRKRLANKQLMLLRDEFD